jgi:hypothetical protein
MQAGAHLLNRGNIQPIVSSFPRHDLRRHWQAQRIQRRQHHLELGQVGTVITTRAQLEQSLLRHRPIPARRGAIDPHPLRLQLVDPHDPLVQGRFEVLPLLVITEGIQHKTQSVIAPFLVANSLSAALLQRGQPRGCPWLNLIHPVVTLGQNERQPDRCSQAQAGSLPIAMGLKGGIQQFCYPHSVALCQQHRNIVHSFCRNGKLFCHIGSLSQFQYVVTI